MNVEPPETLAIIESIVYKSNGFAISGACPVLVLSFFRNKFNIGDRLQDVVYSKLKFLQYKLIE